MLNVTETWSVIGTVNDTAWDTDFDMTFDANTGICTVTGISYKAGDEFKLRKAHGWQVSAGLKEGVSTVGDAAWDGYLLGGSNINIKLAEAGVYTLTFKPEDYTFTATKTGDVAPAPTAVWKVVGLGDVWAYDNGVAMTENEGVWEADITYAATDTFKLLDGTTWVGMQSGWQYYGLGDFSDGYLSSADGAPNIKLEAAGDYHLAFTPSTMKFVVTAATAVDPQP